MEHSSLTTKRSGQTGTTLPMTASTVATGRSPGGSSNGSVTRSAVPPGLPTGEITFPMNNRNYTPAENVHRAVHIVRLSSLRHNFLTVESAAAKQRCSVITVVKADGYGHGAICTALHLADTCGADAFAVATLEEGIALRKALEQNPAGSRNLANLFGQQQQQQQQQNGSVGSENGTTHSATQAARCRRPPHVRILVLGPPVGFPNSFNDYYHYNIEVMISGPEAAASLAAWIANEKERKQTQVERAAMEAKEQALVAPRASLVNKSPAPEIKNPKAPPQSMESAPAALENTRKALRHPSSTLGNVSGQDLAREVRALLMNQKAATEAAEQEELQEVTPSVSKQTSVAASRTNSSDNSLDSLSEPLTTAPQNKPPLVTPQKQVFGGIEAVAKTSRVRQQALAKAGEKDSASMTSSPVVANGTPPPPPTRKRLRWHALVDSGMGRLGFKTELVSKEDKSGRRDTVDIIQELVNAEIHANCPIEFFGMCTHMADANSTSTYTHDQIGKFVALLQRVRAAGISIPTVSTDNSAALLTTNLTHFDPEAILSQPFSNTRGYVRCGGAIYGQRPAFRELKGVSTLTASVRHVAILAEGESVGYDRAYVAPYDVRIATLTIGFADGYPRELGNGVGKVAIRGSAFPVAGNVCMDMLMVELGPAEETDGVGATVVVGDTAVLWGPIEDDQDEGLVRLQDIASTLKTTQSALTCGLDKVRVSRLYI